MGQEDPRRAAGWPIFVPGGARRRQLITASPSRPTVIWQIISEGQHAAARQPLRPALLIEVASRGSGDSAGFSSLSDSKNNELFGGLQRLGAQVPQPFNPAPPPAGGPFP